MLQVAGKWKDVDVIVVRPRPVDPNGPCGNSQPQDDIKRVTLPTSKYLFIRLGGKK